MSQLSGGVTALKTSHSRLEFGLDAGFSNDAQDISGMQRLCHARIVFFAVVFSHPFSTFRLFHFYPYHSFDWIILNLCKNLSPALFCCFMCALINFVFPTPIYISLLCTFNILKHRIRSLFISPSVSVCNPAF